jgi:hypothetical protein
MLPILYLQARILAVALRRIGKGADNTPWHSERVWRAPFRDVAPLGEPGRDGSGHNPTLRH